MAPTLALVQTIRQINLSAIDRAVNITNFTKIMPANVSFFSTRKRDLFFNFCVCHKKSKIVN